MAKFNLNNNMSVDLTKAGWRVLRQYNKAQRAMLPQDLIEPHDESFRRKISGDTYTDQGWKIMEIFGRHLTVVSDLPFWMDVKIDL